MITEFQLTGLSKVGSVFVANCRLSEKEDEWFKAMVYGDDNHKRKLWESSNKEIKKKKIAIIEHDGFSTSGMPKNPVMLYYRIDD